MDISGSYTLYAPRERVWGFLLDPQRLQAAIPGCEELEKLGPNRYRLRLNVGVAAVKGVYSGTLALSDLRPPESYQIAVDGSGLRGGLHGGGSLTLEARDPTTTVVSYQGRAQLRGAIASLGSRIAQPAARTLINQFFARLADQLDEAQSPAATLTTAPEVPPAPVIIQASPLTSVTSGADWGMGIPEARPLGSELGPTEAAPLPSQPSIAASGQAPVQSVPVVTPAQPRRIEAHPVPAANAPRLGHPAVPNPAPAFATDFVRRMGLSNGSVENENAVAWRLILLGAIAGGIGVALAVGLLGVLLGRSRR